MSDQLSHLPEPDELHDRLIDVSLRELLGGEAPPDLSQRILTAASAVSPAEVRTPAPLITAGGSEMNANQPSSSKSRFPWVSIAIAVCLLVGAAFLLGRPYLTPAKRAASVNNAKDLTIVDAGTTHATERRTTADEISEIEKGQRKALSSDTKIREWDGLYMRSGVPADSDDSAATGATPAGDQLATDSYGAVNLAPTTPALATAGIQAAPQQQGGAAQPDFGDAIAGKDGPESEVTELLGVRQSSAQPAEPALAFGATAAGEQSGSRQQSEHSAGAAAPPQQLATIAGNGDLPETFGWHDQRTNLNTSEAAAQTSPAPTGAGVVAPGSAEWQLGVNRGTQNSSSPSSTLRGFEFRDGKQESRRYDSKGRAIAEGSGPGAGRDQYARIVDNPFRAVSPANTDNRLSTFSIDVDTASYANTRQFLMQSNMLPPPDAVRIEELVNYFDYGYSAPTGDVPFASNVEVAACPWAPEHRLVRVGIKGREMDRAKRPMSNIVFLIDVSGSMNEPAKLPLLVEGMKMLTRELGENDRVAIVVYASSEGMALDSTRGDQQQTILEALGRLQAGGSTAGGAGIQLAYKVAEKNFIKDGVNRIILCTDGDFNVGVTSPAELQRLAEEKAKDTGVFLTVIGFGRGNLNDAMMEQVADHGNGNYHYVDNKREARKVLVEEMTGTLVTIAKDVKIQIEFNPAKVAGYRLIGYENRVLAAQDFNDDKKDAGEIGAGHTVTALYEIVPAGQAVNATGVDELKYGPKPAASATPTATGAVPVDDLTQMSDELLTLKIRFKKPDGDTSEKLEFPISDNGQKFAAASQDFQFAASVAGFGMLLRGSQYKGDASFAGVLEIAESASRDRDPHGYRREFVEMVQRARELSGQ